MENYDINVMLPSLEFAGLCTLWLSSSFQLYFGKDSQERFLLNLSLDETH